MANFLTSLAEWAPVVRIKLGVSDVDLPDSDLNNAILVELSEQRVKDVLTDWAASFTLNPSVVKIAACCFLAHQFCDHCEKVVMALEYDGPYRSERQKIDWEQKAIDLIGEAYMWMGHVDPDVSLVGEAVAVVSPATPLFTEIE